jgi:hypothetical protein
LLILHHRLINVYTQEGEVISGDLDGEFVVRCDDGAVFRVNGWLGDVEVVSA